MDTDRVNVTNTKEWRVGRRRLSNIMSTPLVLS
jgi:hypothetical protein